jgi:hypothetical protein
MTVAMVEHVTAPKRRRYPLLAGATEITEKLYDRLDTVDDICQAMRKVNDESGDELTSLARAFLAAGDEFGAAAALWVREARWDDSFIPPIIWAVQGSWSIVRDLYPMSEGVPTATAWVEHVTQAIRAEYRALIQTYRTAHSRASTYAIDTVSIATARSLRGTGHQVTQRDLETLVNVASWCNDLAVSLSVNGNAALYDVARGVRAFQHDAMIKLLKAFAEHTGTGSVSCRHLPYAAAMLDAEVEPDHGVVWIEDMADTLRGMTSPNGAPIHTLWALLMPPAREAESAWLDYAERRMTEGLEIIRSRQREIRSTA